MPMAEGSYKLFSSLLVFEGKSRGGWGGEGGQGRGRGEGEGIPPWKLSVMNTSPDHNINFASTAAVNCPEQLVA